MVRTPTLLLALVMANGIARAPAQPAEAAAHKQKGIAYAREGNPEAAEKEFRQAARLAPGDPEVLGSLGSVLAMSGKLEQSCEWLEKALAIQPGDMVTRRNLATNQWRLARLPEARLNLEKVLKANPADQQATLILGMVAESQQDHAHAAWLLASVPALLSAQPAAVMSLARAYYHTGKRAKARAVLEPMMSQPVSSEAVFLAGRMTLEAKDYETAERLWSSLRSSYPDPATLGFNIAQAQYHRNHFAASERTLKEEVMSAARVPSDAYNLLGWCLEKQDRRNEAIEAFTKAIELEPTRESNYIDLASILATSARRLTAAEAIARHAVELFPSSYNIWALRGSIETKLQQYKDAVESYSVAANLKPNSADPQREVAIALWSSGESKQATHRFDQLLAAFPKDALTFEAYGTALFKTASGEEMMAQATQLLEKAISLDASLAEPHFYLGNRALDQGNLREALSHLETAVKLDPRSSKMRFALSRALKRAGRTPESQREFAVYSRLKSDEDQAEQR
jgi:tetratricopeptide (TPR) repeat protein